jgi:hypothetical protein
MSAHVKTTLGELAGVIDLQQASVSAYAYAFFHTTMSLSGLGVPFEQYHQIGVTSLFSSFCKTTILGVRSGLRSR